MNDLELLTRRDCIAVLLASGALSLAVVGATLLTFAADGRTEWFSADSTLALAAQRCDKEVGSTEHHHCRREVADAQRATNGEPTRLARR